MICTKLKLHEMLTSILADIRVVIELVNQQRPLSAEGLQLSICLCSGASQRPSSTLQREWDYHAYSDVRMQRIGGALVIHRGRPL